MKTKLINGGKPLTAAVSAALALSLGACGQKLPAVSAPEKSSGLIEQPKDKDAKNDPAPGAAPGTNIAGNVDTDATLAARVKSALDADPVLKVFALDARIAQGVVMLYGAVDNPVNRSKAADIALNTPGVLAVRNNIQLTRGS